jgi:hypothetical protein
MRTGRLMGIPCSPLVICHLFMQEMDDGGTRSNPIRHSQASQKSILLSSDFCIQKVTSDLLKRFYLAFSNQHSARAAFWAKGMQHRGLG